MLLERPEFFKLQKKIREAMCAYIERENIKLGGATLFVVEEKPVLETRATKDFWESAGCG